jgi:hypothetical protein
VGFILASFGLVRFETPDGEISLDDSITFVARNIGGVPLRLRAVLNDVNLTSSSLHASMLNILSLSGEVETRQKIVASTPSAFMLGQNYPNPFNPTTTIGYSIPRSGNVSLKVFDVLGREVASLVDGFMPSGDHTVTLDGARLASGVYFYRLESTGSVNIRRMILIK